MKSPTLNPLLTGIASRFMQGLPSAGLRLFPVFNTPVQAANYYVYDTSNITDVPLNIQRAPSAGFKRIISKLSNDTFSAKDYGVEEVLDKLEIRHYASVFSADRAALERAVRIVAVNHEIRARNLARGLTQTSSPSVKWNAASGTTIIADIQAAKDVIQAATGMDPNVLVLPRAVYNALRNAAEIKEYFKYTAGGPVTLDQLTAALQVDEIVVGNTLINNANEGQTASIGNVWSDEAVLAISNPSADFKALTLGRTFNWTGADGSGPAGISTFTYDENEIDSRVVRARQYTDEKIVAPGAGYYFSDVLS